MEPIFIEYHYVPDASKIMYGLSTKFKTHPVLTLVPTTQDMVLIIRPDKQNSDAH